MTTHELDCDVLVAGGGPAGVPCAIAAARGGAKVILCQDRSVLGGNASSEVRMHIVGADCSGFRASELSVEAREGGIIEEIKLETSVRNPQRSSSMLDLILYEKCRAEPNLTLMLDTTVTGAQKKGSRITHAIAERPSTEDRFHIAAKIFIDCTGDGRLGAEAGASFRMGREAKSEFNESMAQDQADRKTLGSTLLFMASKHDRPMPFVAPPWARKFTEEDLKRRPHASVGIDRGPEYGYWWCEWGGELDTIKDNEKIRAELLAIVMGIWDHVKNGAADDPNYPNPDSHNASHWALDWFAFLPAKRESRRFEGQYMLTEHDVMQSLMHEDAITFGGWPIDTHPPGGVDAKDEAPCDQHEVPHLYDIPLRACVSRDVPNLMFAGRNISATHIAFASTRVMATCAAVGQGVGTAAAYAVSHELEPGALAKNLQAIKSIQDRLMREDMYLIGRPNGDPDDVAPQATVTASSEQSCGPARDAISGQTRAVHGEMGAPPARAHPPGHDGKTLHRWMSDPAAGLPAWLELRWDRPVRAGQIRLVFDTGMHRPLSLTHSDAYAARMEWGRAQSETVRDYAIQGQVDGQWRTLVEVKGNYQRLRVHDVAESPLVTALRVQVTATNGLNHARVMEVRVYEKAKAW